MQNSSKLGSGPEVNYSRIHGNLSCLFFMQQVDLDDYTRHDHLLAYKKIVWEFYALLEMTMGDQPAHTVVRG